MVIPPDNLSVKAKQYSKYFDEFGSRFIIFFLVVVIILQAALLWRFQQLWSDENNEHRLSGSGNVAVDYSAQNYTHSHLKPCVRSPSSALCASRWYCIKTLWLHESGWNKYARNPTSGAYGIPQALPASKMASAGSDWRTNGVTQVRWGLGYIWGRYGNTCRAWSFWQSHNWY